jgi:hypothetical protein
VEDQLNNATDSFQEALSEARSKADAAKKAYDNSSESD